jgi:hypothetical protein
MYPFEILAAVPDRSLDILERSIRNFLNRVSVISQALLGLLLCLALCLEFLRQTSSESQPRDRQMPHESSTHAFYPKALQVHPQLQIFRFVGTRVGETLRSDCACHVRLRKRALQSGRIGWQYCSTVFLKWRLCRAHYPNGIVHLLAANYGLETGHQ